MTRTLKQAELRVYYFEIQKFLPIRKSTDIYFNEFDYGSHRYDHDKS